MERRWWAAPNCRSPAPWPPPVYLAALQPAMLRLAGSVADGTITWCTGPITVEQHIVPLITAAAVEAGRPASPGGGGVAVLRH